MKRATKKNQKEKPIVSEFHVLPQKINNFKHMKPIITFLIIVSFVVGSSLAVYSQNPEQVYQKALVKEEGEGALLEAINLYKQVADNTNAGNSLQAKALLHVGLCYEKMGKEEALKAYQRLVTDFPGQKSEVAIARERLNKLIKPQKENKVAKISSKILTNTKIWDEADTDLEGEISPDGRYLSYVDWDTGDLAVFETNTGKKRRLTNKGSWDESGAYAQYSIWSPEGNKIVYSWENEESFVELRMIGLYDSKSDILLKDKEVVWVEIYDWSPDSETILVSLYKKDKSEEVVLISATDGSVKILDMFNNNCPGSMVFSPDGRYIAYDRPQSEENNKDIHILELDTKIETVLVEHLANDRVVGWLPFSNDFLFVSDRTGSSDFWMINVEKGKAISEPVLIKGNEGPFWPTNLGFTENGSFYYGILRNRINIYEMEIDPVSGKVDKKPKRIIERFIGCNGTPQYSRNGEFLAYVSRRPPGTMRFTTNPTGNVLCIKSLRTGEEKGFRPDINVFGFPQWSPDGKSVIVVNFSSKYHFSYYQINTETGKTTPVLITNGRNLFGGHYFSNDGEILYHGLIDDKTKKYKIVARNLNEKTVNTIYETNKRFAFTLSFDGQFFGILSDPEKSLKILPVTGGEPRELFKSQDVKDLRLEDRVQMLTWSRDGEFIYFADRLSQKEGYGWDLYRVSIKDGKIKDLNLRSKGHFINLNPHPDGRRFTYSARDKSNAEVWKMENFLPLDKLAQKGEAKEPEGISIKQLPNLAGIQFGSPSPDGNFFSYMDGETGNVAIGNLKTEEKRNLTTKGTWDGPMQFANFSKISPDNKWVAYSWQYVDNGNKFDLRIVNVDNPVPRILYDMKDGEVHPAFWLSDNKRLIAYTINTKNKTYQIISVKTDDGSFNVLNTFKKLNGISGLCLSSDGKNIAFDFQNGTNKNFDIYSIPVEGGPEISLVEHPANDRMLGWLPARNEFLFLSDRKGTWDIWSLSVINGNPSGQPKLLYADIGKINPVEITQNGTLYFTKFVRKFTSTISPFNVKEGTINKKSGLPLLDSNYGVEWSPDGQSIVYNKEIIEIVGRTMQLFVQDINTRKERQIAKNLETGLASSWSPNGNEILTLGLDKRKMNDKNYFAGIYKIDVKSGKETEVLTFSRDSFKNPSNVWRMAVEWSLDGKNIFYVKENQIIKRNLETGQENTFYKAEQSLQYFKRSPSGNEFVFKEGEKIMKTSGKDGVVREICSVEGPKSGIISWSSDEKYIYLRADKSLCKVPSNGGAIQNICPLEKGIRYISFNPGEQKIAIAKYDQRTEFRKIENLTYELDKIYSLNE